MVNRLGIARRRRRCASMTTVSSPLCVLAASTIGRARVARLSIESAIGSAGGGDPVMTIRLALAADRLTGIGGGFPIVVDGHVVGAIGVSSGTVDEDIVVARAGLAAIA